LRHLFNTFTVLEYAIESADAAPTIEQRNALQSNLLTAKSTLAHWNQLLTHDLAQLNAKLKAAGGAEVTMKTASSTQ
jgi:hypothetical protein